MRPWKIREVDDVVHFKLENESVFHFFTFSLTSEIEIKCKKKSSSSKKKSDDKDKCKLVIERVAHENPLAALPC